MNLVVAGTTQRLKVVSGVCATLGDWYDVMYLLCRNKFTVLLTDLAKRMQTDVSVTDAFPRTTVLLIHIGSTLVLVILSAGLGGVGFTILPLCKAWTAGVRTGALGFSRHSFTSYACVPGTCSAGYTKSAPNSRPYGSPY